MPNATLITPDQLNPIGDATPWDFGNARKCLAQGDSWFSIGAVPFWATSNLLSQLVLSCATVVVNCAYPGRELAHMVDTTIDSKFIALLAGKLSYKWDAILLSGGGNDLIDALQAPPTNPPEARILLAADEWGPESDGVERYLSEPGWTAFETHMNVVVDHFLAVRDQGQNAATPVILHTYDYPTPRPAGAGPLGPWLYPALNTAYAIPPADWDALARRLIDRLALLLEDIVAARAQRGLLLVPTRGTLASAADGSSGPSGDWENEIHPSAHGYSLLARKWQPIVESVICPPVAAG